MSVCGEEQTPNNECETKTVLNIELLFARLDLISICTPLEKRHCCSRCDGLTESMA